jgi:hypothetical protein
VSKATTFDSSFVVNTGGTLNQSGGTLTVNGNVLFTTGSNFNQSGGILSVDGNNGGSVTGSVAAGTRIFSIGTSAASYATGTISLTGGKIIIVDPHTSTSTSDYAFITSLSATANNITASASHTLQMGDGVSTDAGGSTSGFNVNFWPVTGAFKTGNYVINAPVGTNRHVTQVYRAIIGGNLTVTSGELRFTATSYYLAGNLFVDTNGIFTNTVSVFFSDANYTGGTSVATLPVTVGQTVSGPGVFRNLTTAPTANFNSVTINNTSAAGVTFAGLNAITDQPANSASVSSTLTFTAGKIATTGNATFVLGTSVPAAGTLSYTAGGFASGTTFGRWYTATGTGSSLSAGTEITSATSRYPFVNATGQDRSAWIERVAPTAASGVLAVTYNNVAGTTTGNYLDGAASVNTKLNDTWQVTAPTGTPLANATSFKLQLAAPGGFSALPLGNAGARIIQGSAFAGTHQAGTVTPQGSRIGLTGAELTGGAFSVAINNTDLAVYTVASGNWNSPATWNTGAVPVCTDVITIASGHTVTVNSAANVSKNVTIATGATLTIASGDLSVGCTLNNNTFINNGTLNINGGTLNVNGNFDMNNGASLNQTAGEFNIDGNAGGNATGSVASGTPIFRIGNSTTSYSTGVISLTGGAITIVDPHTATSASSGYALYAYFPTGFNVESGAGHIFNFGNGTSTDAGGHASGFYVDPYVSSGRLNFGTLRINNPSGTNRNVVTAFTVGAHGDVYVLAGDFRPAGLILKGNLSVTGGNYIATGALTLAAPLGTGSAVNTAAQNIGFTAPGIIKNAATAETANFTSISVNNSNTAGVTINNPLSLSGTLTLTSGKVNTTAANLLTIGTTTAAGTISGGSATAYVNGPLARTIATANAATNYVFFPVGKTTYAPVWLAPTTTAVSVFKAEAFETNTGTADASIINLAASKRWEALLVSGTFTDIKVRLGDAALVATNIPVMAPTAAGAYSSTFGSVGTFVAGTPNTIQANNAVTAANYTGYLSFAQSNLCSGTPTPGATIASANNICLGSSVVLSVQNTTNGSGVTYQWQSSTDGVTYADITGATGVTYTTTPAAALYYRLNVTCSAGPVTGPSTPLQVNFANSVTATAPGARCGAGPVSLGATPSAGASILWYTAATGGSSIATGATYTPNVTETTNFYASATVGGGTSILGPVSPTAQGGTIAVQTVDWNVNFTVLQATTLNSVDIFPVTSGQAGTIFVRNASNTILATYTYTTNVSGGATAQTIVLGYALAPGNYQLYTTLPSSGLSRNISGAVYPYTSAVASITGNGYDSTYFMGLYNWSFSSGCESPRVPVTATVNPAPAFTLSAATAAICAGQSTTTPVTIATGAADYDTYVWTPSAGVTGSATSGWTFNPSVTTNYTLSATQSSGAQCATSATFQVTVNPLPSAITLPATVTVCEGGTQQITAAGGIVSIPVFTDLFNSASTQFATSAVSGTPTAVLNNTYFSEGTGSVRFNTTSTGANVSYATNANINLTGAGTAQLTFSHIAAMEGAGQYIYDLGYVEYSADGGTTWATFPTSSYAGGGTLITTQGTATPVSGVVFSTKSYADWTASLTSATAVPTNALWKTETINIPAAALTSQFRVRFRYTTDVSTNYYGWLIDNVKVTASTPQTVWSPATNLYTDAAATVPYVANTVATSVYTKPTAPITYTVSAANSSTGCSVTASVSVTINVTPTPTVANAAQTFCGGATVANLVATGTTVQWYAAATGGTALASTTVLVNGTTYYASQTLNGCESVLRTPVAATVNTTAAPTASAQTFCNAATVAQLTATGTTVQWYAAATGGTALASTTALATGNYYASQTLNGCESATRAMVAVTVNVTAAPTASAQTFCNAATVAELTATGTGVQWYAAATGGTALLSTTALATGNYYASQTLNGCESATRAIVAVAVNVTAAPAASAQTFCNAATVAELTATGTGIQWYAAATGGTALTAGTALVNGTTYYASQTLNGCESATRTGVVVTISVTAAPTASAQTFCNDATVAELTATGTGIQWYAAATGGTALTADSALVNGTTYYASQTVNGCESATRAAVAVTINTTAAPTGATTQTISIVAGDTATIEDIVVVATGTVTWYGTEADALAGVDALAAGTVLVTGNTYYATQTIDSCTSATVLAVTVSVVLGRDDFEAKVFTYYPNPVKDVLTVSYANEITSISVVNLLGQEVIKLQPNAIETRVDMTGLADGTYLVTLRSGTAVKTVKIVKGNR